MVKSKEQDRLASAEAEKTVRFQQTVFVHLNAAYSLARYLARRSDAAEDIVQEALLRAYRGFEGQRGDNPKAWLLAIVRNCFLSWHEYETGRKFKDEDEAAYVELATYAPLTPETLLIQHDDARAIRAIIEQVPHPFREALVLRDLEDLSYHDIAQITHVPIGTVMSRLARGRKIFAVLWNGAGSASEQAALDQKPLKRGISK